MSLAVDALSDKRICVLGLGREGLSTYRFLRARFPLLPIILADKQDSEHLSDAVKTACGADGGVKWSLGPDYAQCLTAADVCFKSPGIRPDLPPLVEARRRGLLVTSNTALFLAALRDRVIGVTGTKGKSTTAAVMCQVLRAGGLRALLLGNIGLPPLDRFQEALAAEVIVAELSSFQLLDIDSSPHIAVVQNIVPEHLDYHGSFGEYVAAKARIGADQGVDDVMLYNTAGGESLAVAQRSRARRIGFGLEKNGDAACYLADDDVCYRSADGEERLLSTADIPLPGRFNAVNVLPAVIVGKLFGLKREQIRQGIREFKALEHRLEFCAELNGVRYYDDSLATVPQASIAAVDAFAPAAVVLIAGGHDRGVDYEQYGRELASRNIRAVVLFRPSGERIAEALRCAGGVRGCAVDFAETMEQAVQRCHAVARAGDVVLLSPASASFGRFMDYRDRGSQFKIQVQSLCRQNRALINS